MISDDNTNSKYWTEEELSGALKSLKNDGLILVKGDIGYGLFGTSEQAIRKMYSLKNRIYSNPCIVIANLMVLKEIADIPHQKILEWIERTAAWTTLAVVLPVRKKSRLLNTLPSWVYNQTVTKDTVAAFLNTGPYLEELIQRAYKQDVIFVGSSANPSSHGNIYDFAELPEAFISDVDFYVNHGRAKYANEQRLATTIVNFANWSIKRRGVNWEQIEQDFNILKDELQGVVVNNTRLGKNLL